MIERSPSIAEKQTKRRTFVQKSIKVDKLALFEKLQPNNNFLEGSRAPGVLIRGILAIPRAGTVLKGPRIAKFLHKRGKIWGRNNEIFRRVGKTLIRDFFEAFPRGNWPKTLPKSFYIQVHYLENILHASL